MVRSDNDSYPQNNAAERGTKIIKSWDLTELEPEEGGPPVDLKQFLEGYLGAEHEAVTAAASGDPEHPLSAEACEALLKAFDPRAAVEAERARQAAAAAKKAPVKKQEQPLLSEEEAESRAQVVLREAEEQAEALLDQARQEAEAAVAQAQEASRKMLDEAALKRQEIYAAAQKQGYGEGVAASRSALLKVREDYETRLKDFFEQTRAYNEARNAELERNVLAMSVEVAEKILGAKLEADSELFLNMVQHAVTELNAKTRFTIRLNKREYDRLMEDGDAKLRERLGEAPFSVICDGSLEPGALLLQADEGTLDAGLKTQLSRAKNVFGVAGDAT